MKKKANNYFIFFVIVGLLFFAHKKIYEGYYGYNRQFDSPASEWTPCDINFYSVSTSPRKKKCCSNISIWNSELSLCHPQCAKGQTWNPDTISCVSESTRCPEGYPTYNGNGKCLNVDIGIEVDSNF